MTLLDHALSLAARGFYVFPIVPGKKAPPLVTDFPGTATMDAPQITYWWKLWPNANIGISTTKFQENSSLLVVDIDNKGDKHGDAELLRLELEGWELPETCSQATPTGGRHLVYRVEAPVHQGANVLGAGLDVRSKGGYIVGAGSQTDRGAYTIDDRPVADAPAWLIERCRPAPERPHRQDHNRPIVPIDGPRAEDRAIHYLTHEAPLAIQGQGGDEMAYKVAARCKDFGLAELDTLSLMLTHWNDRCEPPWAFEELGRKVANGYRYGTEPVGIASPEADFAVPFTKHEQAKEVNSHPFDIINNEYAFVLAGGGAHILWETTDKDGRYRLEHLDVGAFKLKFAPQKMMVGKTERPLSTLWLEWKGRRQYDGLVFAPAQSAPARFYNLWRGFAYHAADSQTGHPALTSFLEHVHANVCRGDAALSRWLLGYFAHLLQRPFDKPLVALVLRGGKGVGKNAVIETVGALLGGHFLLTSNRRYLVGNFNGHLENCLLFALDEAFWSGDKQAEGTLKDLITGREHVIEHKGKEPYTVANKTRIAIIGNEDWLVPASHDERRFAVLDVGSGRKQDRVFFQAMRDGMEGGGYSHLLRYLLDYPLAGLDLNAAPQTQGLIEQKHHTMDPFHQWWFACLEEGRILGAEFTDWPAEIECERFRAAFRRYVKERQIRSRIPEDRTIGRLLKKCAPGVLKRRMSKREDGQPYGYKLPKLSESRTEWDTFIGQKTEWAD